MILLIYYKLKIKLSVKNEEMNYNNFIFIFASNLIWPTLYAQWDEQKIDIKFQKTFLKNL